jgi:hypothetical protein
MRRRKPGFHAIAGVRQFGHIALVAATRSEKVGHLTQEEEENFAAVELRTCKIKTPLSRVTSKLLRE